MGMGLLGAVGGLAEAGGSVGKQMMQAALKEDEINYLQQKQLMVDKAKLDLQKAYANEERTRIGEVVKGATGPVSVDGPPTEDGVMPTREMSHKEKTKAAGQALISSGYMKEGEGLLNIASREDSAESRYYTQKLINEQKLAGQLERNLLNNATKLHGIDTRANAAAALQKLRESRGGSGQGSSGKSGGTGGSGGADYDKFYNEFFKADEKAGLNFNDVDGFSVFKQFLIGAKQKHPSASVDALAAEAIRQISGAREAATGPNGINMKAYRQLLDSLGREKNPTLQDDPGMDTASVINQGMRDSLESSQEPAPAGGGMLASAEPKQEVPSGISPMTRIKLWQLKQQASQGVAGAKAKYDAALEAAKLEADKRSKPADWEQ